MRILNCPLIKTSVAAGDNGIGVLWLYCIVGKSISAKLSLQSAEGTDFSALSPEFLIRIEQRVLILDEFLLRL